jgi:hypothetical protein
MDWVSGPGLYLAAGLAITLIVLLVWVAGSRRPKDDGSA